MPPTESDAECELIDAARQLVAGRGFDVNDLSEAASPLLLIDEAVLDRNIERMAAYCRAHGIGLRPHAKTHKSLEIARRQLAAGAIGLACAKPGEARVLAAAGASLLIAYPPITPASVATIDRLRREVEVLVALDSLEAVERLAALPRSDAPAVKVLVDVDLGLHRTGVGSPEESTRIAERIAACDALALEGLFCYPGQISEPGEAQAMALRRAAELLARHCAAWAARRLPVNVVSGGSTPTAFHSHLMEAVTEIRPGTYVFNDVNTLRAGHCRLADCAATVVTTVISTAVAGQVVVDAGSKTLARDKCFPLPESGFGFVLEYPEAKVSSLSEEHGQIDVSRCRRPPRIGERVSIVPNHVCPAVNLTDAMWLRTTGGELQRLPVDARGMVQ